MTQRPHDRELLADGAVRLSSGESAFDFVRPRVDVLVVTITGYDPLRSANRCRLQSRRPGEKALGPLCQLREQLVRLEPRRLIENSASHDQLVGAGSREKLGHLLVHRRR